MKKLNFTKMVASGNDFVIIDKSSLSAIRYPLSAMAKKICDRIYGIGADGLLVIEKSKRADIKMRIFNADGTEAEMCGNGARCAVLYAIRYMLSAKTKITIETRAGIIEGQIKKDNVRIKLTDPKDIKLDIPIKINNRILKVNFINTGVPHTIVFVEGLDKINVQDLGRQIRYHKTFAPRGTNVDFVEAMDKNSIGVRTYERGVEDETLACGTGSVASVLLSAIRYPLSANKINVHTQSGEILKVYFDVAKCHCERSDRGRNVRGSAEPSVARSILSFKNVWLQGNAKIIYRGEYYV